MEWLKWYSADSESKQRDFNVWYRATAGIFPPLHSVCCLCFCDVKQEKSLNFWVSFRSQSQQMDTSKGRRGWSLRKCFLGELLNVCVCVHEVCVCVHLCLCCSTLSITLHCLLIRSKKEDRVQYTSWDNGPTHVCTVNVKKTQNHVCTNRLIATYTQMHTHTGIHTYTLKSMQTNTFNRIHM